MRKYVRKFFFSTNLYCRSSQFHKKKIKQSKVKVLVERQDRWEVIIEVLMGKMGKLSIEMNNRYDVPSCKGKEVKRTTR